MSHTVTMKLPPRELKRADAVFEVTDDDGKLGTLHVSNGSVVWFPRNTSYGFKMGWQKFNQIMSENARRVEKR